MFYKNKQKISAAIFFLLCVAILVTTTILIKKNSKAEAMPENRSETLELWQIDSFEGGKGSRATYLKNVGEKFYAQSGVYIHVTSITSEAARINIKKGTIPDMISYGAGMYGIENIITGEVSYYTWAHGGYCFISTEDGADFSDINDENLVVNAGNENFADGAALICGYNEAKIEKPTEAYVNLINGKYKYLLGTQRDIYRLKTRGTSFKIKPITEFNDLYQNISITSNSIYRQNISLEYINFLLSDNDALKSIGLMGKSRLYTDEMAPLDGIDYEFKLVAPINEATHDTIEQAILNSDSKMLKILLK